MLKSFPIIPRNLPMRLTLTSLAFAVSCGAAMAQDAAPPARYTIKQASPSTGSNIPRNDVTSGAIPINRRYSELTREQQAILKSRYEAIAQDDEPPFPVDGLEPLFAAMSKGQQKYLARGVMEIHVEIDANGSAKAARVFQSPDADMTKFAAAVLMLTKYKPGVCAGVPCAMAFPFLMTFSIRR
jgi:hypothetical protein